MKFENMTESETYKYFFKEYEKQLSEMGEVPDMKCFQNMTPAKLQKVPGFPSFRSFIFVIIEKMLSCDGDLYCLYKMDGHLRSQSSKCQFCTFRYDAVVQVG